MITVDIHPNLFSGDFVGSFVVSWHGFFSFVAVAVAGAAGSFLPAAEDQPSAEALKFFETEVRPILAGKCYKCHGPKKESAELRLDSLAASCTVGQDFDVLLEKA